MKIALLAWAFAVALMASEPNAADGTTPLILAAHMNDLAKVELLLKQQADPKPANAYGITAMLEAARHGNGAMLEVLMKAGADPNVGGPDGETALMLVARSGNAAAIQTMASHGAQVNARETWKGQTALMWAAAANHAEAARALISAGAQVDARSISWPVKPKKKEDGNLVSEPPRGGLTPLLFAARNGALDAARVLVAAGTDVNLSEPDGISPTMMALINGHFDLAYALIDAGADPNSTDKWGRTALYIATDMYTLEPSVTRPAPKTSDAKTGLDVARLALAHGAKVDAALTESAPGRGPSDYADPILRKGTTAFLRAAKTGDLESMRLLVASGANPKAVTGQGVTALMAAAGLGWRFGDSVVPEAGSLAAVKYCLELGLDPNASAEDGRTALHGAGERGATAIAELLVSHGAKMDAKNKQGHTPVDVARGAGGGHPEYVETVAALSRLAQEAK